MLDSSREREPKLEFPALRTTAKMTTLRDNPHVLLGVNEAGKLTLYVSPFELNPIGMRLERGKSIPYTVGRFLESTEGDEQDMLAIQALRDFNKYLHPKPKKQ